MKKENSKLPLILWISSFVVCGVIVFFLTKWLSNADLDVKDWLGIYGSYASLFGLLVILIQFQSVKETTRKTQEEIGKLSSITEWSRYAEMASGLKEDIRHNDFTLAAYKLHHIKQAIICVPDSFLDKDSSLIKKQKECIKAINGHISSLDSLALNTDTAFSFEKMMRDIEIVSDFFKEMINHKLV